MREGWQARLELVFEPQVAAVANQAATPNTVCRHTHQGPLRVLRTLYPEGPAVAHQVLLHPPSGLVGGDQLQIHATVRAHAHGVLTTPGATRFYRSEGPEAVQQLHWRLAAGARAEWLPLETLVHAGARAVNQVSMQLEPGASMLGWDILGLGMPAAGEPLADGRVHQRLTLDAVWLDEALIDGRDSRLLHSPLGLAGRTASGTLWLAQGEAFVEPVLGDLLEAARQCIDDASVPALDAGRLAGVTALHPRVLVVRALAHHTMDVLALFRVIRARWRSIAWGLAATEPRVWQC